MPPEQQVPPAPGPAPLPGTRRRGAVVVAHPSPDLYGSDLQLLESISALVDRGRHVVLVLPEDGPLAPRAAARGAEVRLARFPVLRKSLLHPRRLPGALLDHVRALVGAAHWLRGLRPDLVYVNTLTLPVWTLAARLAGTRVLCHVHEAEEDAPRPVVAALTAPLLLDHAVVANSETARRALALVFGSLASRTRVVYNGVPGPAEPVPSRSRAVGDPLHLVLVGRLSPRKGTDVALEAVAQLVARGVDARIRLCGSVFPGYEWFEDELRRRAAGPDLAGRVELLGYVADTWPELAAADVVLVPSRVEPFGNTAVEALLAGRPLVVSDTQGLAEIVRPGVTGLLAAPGDAAALADAVARLAEDPAAAAALAARGRADARARFGVDRYAGELADAVEAAARA